MMNPIKSKYKKHDMTLIKSKIAFERNRRGKRVIIHENVPDDICNKLAQEDYKVFKEYGKNPCTLIEF